MAFGIPDAREGRTLDVLALLFGCALWGLAWWPMKGLAARGLPGPTLAVVALGFGLVARGSPL